MFFKVLLVFQILTRCLPPRPTSRTLIFLWISDLGITNPPPPQFGTSRGFVSVKSPLSSRIGRAHRELTISYNFTYKVTSRLQSRFPVLVLAHY